jgi:hypothetical protein
MTGNGLGLSQNEAESLSEEELSKRLGTIEQEFFASGAHFVIRSAADLIPLLEQLNDQLSREAAESTIR